MNENQVCERLDQIEGILRQMVQKQVVQKFYSTADMAKLLGKADFTVREWCRQGRIHAEKRPCGRGNSQEWMISHDELLRIQAEGLLRPKHGL